MASGSWHTDSIRRIILFSLLNDDPAEKVYQFEGHRFSYNNGKNKSKIEDVFGMNLNIFDDTNDVETDDFYGRTREIIIFAEKGMYKFSMTNFN